MLPYLGAYITMMPALQARETLALSTAFALGSGNMKKHVSRRIMQDLRRAAEPAGHRRVQKPRTKAEHHAMLAMRGIAVQVG